MNHFEFIEKLKKFEGFANHMYLCTEGKVTFGYGTMIYNEEVAVIKYTKFFINKTTNTVATAKEVREEYRRVFSLPKAKIVSFYGKYTNLIADKTLCDEEFKNTLEIARRDAITYFPDFTNLPRTVQFALWDMSFNLGLPKLKKYKKLKEALSNQKWSEASDQSYRNGVPVERNIVIKNLILEGLKTYHENSSEKYLP